MKREYYGVIGHDNLLREVDSKGIINIDNDALNKYKQERDFKLRLNALVKEHCEIKSEISEIKAMLTLLLKKA
jgi:hypothetical protein